ncbi:MAG: hypothetical protein RL141_424 [Candidatus Parcubacteria bacterium]|jgi:adenylate cyclase
MSAPRFLIRFLRPLAVGFAVGAICSIASLSGILRSWSDQALDRLFLTRLPDPRVIVVAIDDTSLAQVGRWPWDRAVHAALIRRITAGNPAVIGYDVTFAESQDVANDEALAQAIHDAGRVVLPVEIGVEALSEEAPAVADVRPLPILETAARAIGHVGLVPDVGGIVRRVALFANDRTGRTITAFAYELTRVAGRAPTLPPADSGRLRISYPGPRGTIPAVSAVDVLHGTVAPAQFADAIVLVGATAPDLHDEAITPVGILSGVEIHAATVDALLSRRWLLPMPLELIAIVVFSAAFLGALAAAWLRLRWGIAATLVAMIALIVGSSVLFDRGLVLDILWPAAAFLVSFGIVTIEQRWLAERERREIKGVFSRYMSPSVVEALLEDPSKLALGGVRRHMTVFFSDIRGFTTMAEKMKPERLVRVLNAYLDRMTDIVFTHGGVLDKYIGDAVMAFWNAPFDQKDHARRAVATALAMRMALQEMNETHQFGKTDLRIGVGIHTGEMVVGNIGGKARYDYTVIGDSVNLASRLEGITKEYGVDIVVSGNTAAEVGSEILLRRLDKAVVKGKKEPVMLYEAVALTAHATPDKQRLVSDYEHALEKYFSRDFAAATGVCADILSRHPEDGPTKLLLSRSARFIQEPPPEGWAGEWVYTKK